MNEDETEYGHAAITADQYEYVIKRLCEIFKVDRKDKGLYRRAVYSVGEEKVLSVIGMVLVYFKEESQREAFEDQLERLLKENV
jgi:RNA-binding protein YhbY